MTVMNKSIALSLIAILSYRIAFSQQHHMPGMKDSTMMKRDTTKPMMDHQKHMGSTDMSMDPPMTHAYSLHLPMSRDGSGTGWLPDASPMYGYMVHSAKWMYMIHGNIAPRYDKQDVFNKGKRGGEQWDATNWFMLMGQRKIGMQGLFHFNVMLSFDRLTEGGDGYPLLFQSGESWKKVPLVDRQHPHDLFSELSIAYTYAFSKKSDLTVYVGYPGEPALGSVAFMHRPSSLANPDAPISHHWNDGTHITFGVATIGYRYDQFKLEVSSFTGREPNENRYDFDKPKFDSWSGRLSYNPCPNWSFQVSHGYIKSPEMLHPDENVHRTTASAIYSLSLKRDNWLNATALWGENKIADEPGENAALLEAALRLRRFEVYTRYEWVQKSTEELALDEAAFGKHEVLPVNEWTLGLTYDLIEVAKTRLALGAHATWFHGTQQLWGLYGRNPIGAEVFLRIYPALMKMKM